MPFEQLLISVLRAMAFIYGCSIILLSLIMIWCANQITTELRKARRGERT
jgi:hypothetical protein